MKSKVIVEFQGVQTVVKDMEDAAKEAWKSNGGKVKDIKTMENNNNTQLKSSQN